MGDDIRVELDLPPVEQIGFVVRDLEAAMALYDPLFGPFSTMDPGPMSYDYRGREEECDMRLAFGKSGDLDAKLGEVEALGYEAIWKKRYGEGLAVAYLERVGDPLIIELFENHAG